MDLRLLLRSGFVTKNLAVEDRRGCPAQALLRAVSGAHLRVHQVRQKLKWFQRCPKIFILGDHSHIRLYKVEAAVNS